MKKPKISVIGLGFVGLSLAVASAKKSFDTYGIEINKEKLKKLHSGKSDFYEPKLESFLKESLKKKKLILTNELKQVIKTDLTFLTVGTPSKTNGQIDLSHLKKVCLDLSKILKKKKSKHILVVKSTVIPTTTLSIIVPIFKKLKNVIISVNPEFLREGKALNDLFKPHLIVIGASDPKETEILEKYYKLFYPKLPEVLKTDLTTAEMIKYANNAFLATKISFINTIANICQNLPSVDVNEISYAIGKDPRIAPQFLNAGPGFGGSCLPKDLSALIKFSEKFEKTNNLLKTVQEVNQLQPTKIFQILEKMNLLKPKKKISVLGVAFKKDTDDLREAVSIKIVKKLLKKGLQVKIHDPMALENFRKIFGKKIEYYTEVKDCLKNSDCCLILTEWDEYSNLKPSIFKKYMKKTNLIDARRILEPTKFSKFNFRAVGLGT